METDELRAAFEFAIEIAREAAVSTLAHFGSAELSVDQKDDGSPVSVADREAEALLRARIAVRYPEDGVVGEEEGEVAGSNDRRWILDPIDGTVSFVHGVPLFGTLVALEEEDEVVVGVAALPALGELVAGASGLGARWYRGDTEPVPARTSAVARLGEATLCTTSQRGLVRGGQFERYHRLVGEVRHERGWGDLFGHVLVATGRAELALDPVMNLWDNAALLPILEEAGGTFTDAAGVRTVRGGSALSTNGPLFERALGVLDGDSGV